MKNEDIIKIENLRIDKNTYIIRWNITKLCNYSCDFCVQGNKAKHLSDSKKESMKIREHICANLIKFIENEVSKKYQKIYLYLIGGEITILKDFSKILNDLVNSKFPGIIKIFITTNLSTSKDNLQKIKDIFQNKNNRFLNLTASYYKEYTTPQDFIDKLKIFQIKNKIKQLFVNNAYLFKKIKLLKKLINKWEKDISNIYIGVSYPLVTDEDYQAFKKFKKHYKKYVNTINYIIIRNYKKSISSKLKQKLNKNNYPKIRVTLKNNEQIYFTNTSKINIKVSDTFNPKGMYCDSGMNSINNMGDVSRCLSCAKETIITNILDNDLKLISKPFICPATKCNCDYYTLIERRS